MLDQADGLMSSQKCILHEDLLDCDISSRMTGHENLSSRQFADVAWDYLRPAKLIVKFLF